MASAYSVRFRRCRTYRPGLLFRASALSRAVIKDDRKLFSSAVPGVGEFRGGMAPTPSFLTTLSHTAASDPGSERFALSNASGAPAGIFAFSLWQVTQYLFTIS